MDMDTGYRQRLPTGFAIFTSIPDMFYLLEIVFGGLVWTLVASTFIEPHNPQAWVMTVSVFCFCMTLIWMFVFICGTHHSSRGWAAADVFYHFVAAVLYLSAAVPLAKVTIDMGDISPRNTTQDKYYKMNISSSVFAYIATLLYFVHAIFSAIRWKSF
ncbi:hypothetical protein AALO_G00106230 [Alosa alosa]|uniref:MARVEL domain-containing protein n=1 Tax=Alosa alosa TaxID=278164 RepID=A0AAV6GVG7_9TELE|nr:myelin and lymphocyte protein-like [Alosa alosa]KAG5279113.1 hypothetical protein AALO_G00106230 [Alosa alosa]